MKEPVGRRRPRDGLALSGDVAGAEFAVARVAGAITAIRCTGTR